MLSQSGAIMVYVAGKASKLWPAGDANKIAALQWLMFACSDVAGWNGFYQQSMTMLPEKVDANIDYCKQRLLRWWNQMSARPGVQKGLSEST